MATNFELIAANVQKTIDQMRVDHVWLDLDFDPDAPIYKTEIGDTSVLGSTDSLLVLGRYGNWTGADYGAGHISPSFDFTSSKYDLATNAGLSQLLSDLNDYSRGKYFEDPNKAKPRDAFDSLSRYHDLLYQKANLDAANKFVVAAQAYHDAIQGGQNREAADAMLAAAKAEAEAEQTRAKREADVWFLQNSNGVYGDSPYGTALKNFAEVIFGLDTDRYYIQHLPELSGAEVAEQVAERYGSRLGKLIAGDNWLAQPIGETLGGEIGKSLASFLLGSAEDSDDGSALADSLLAAAGGDIPLADAVDHALKHFGVTTEKLEAKALAWISTRLLGEAAEALGLGGFEKYAFTESGKDIAGYLIDQLTGIDDALGPNELVSLLDNGLNIGEVANYVTELALQFVGNRMLQDIVAKARGLVDVETIGEEVFADFVSVVGSIIGNKALPYLGGIIGDTIGYIVGSLVFDAIDFVLGGALTDLFDEDPVGIFYVDFDPATGHLFVDHAHSDQHWDRNGASHATLDKLRDASLKMSDAYLTLVNGVIDRIGGKLDLGFFSLTHTIDGALNHGAIGYHDHAFQVLRAGAGDRFQSQDGAAIVSTAIEYELSHLIFYGGDIALTRALSVWRASVAVAHGEAAGLSDSIDGRVQLDPDAARADTLGLLNANLQIADDYRKYLDNSETINFLMAQAPASAFTIGWVATLARAAELGLNLPYIGSPDGGAGTAQDDVIKSADGADLLFGNEGNDTIRSYGGDDVVYAGSGTDNVIAGSGNDLVAGDAGADTIDGGDGDDTLYGGDDADRIVGGRGEDFILGDGGDDLIDGGPGRDRLFGYQGNDDLSGGAGDDEVAGEEGDDHLAGGDGSDVLFGDVPGAAGRDRIEGGAGDDLARGGAGADRIDGGDGDDRVYGDEGDDELIGGAGADRIFGGDGRDIVDGGAGDDRVLGDAGDDVLAGGTGRDQLYGLAGNDSIDGGADDDRLFGDAGDDSLDGGVGDDQLGGWTGTDRIEGGAGADLIAGEDGDDHLLGGDANDILYGDRQPEVPLGGRTAQEVIDASRARIGAGDFAILYQGASYSFDGLRASDHDLIIVNPAKQIGANIVPTEQLWDPAEVAGIEASGKQLVAYLNLAKVSDLSGEWSSAWVGGDGAPATSLLAGRDGADPHVWLVNFWDAAWRPVLLDRIRTIVDGGYSGLFLDDLLEYFVRRGSSDAGRAQAAREMRDLVIDVAAAAHQMVAERFGQAASNAFTIIVNGAPFLIHDTTADQAAPDPARENAFYQSIDGFLAENYFSQGLDYAVTQAVQEYGSRGIALLSVDTEIVTDQQRIAIERAASNAGFLPEVVPDADYGYDTGRFAPGFGDVPAPGADWLEGGAGDDVLHGGEAGDRLQGGAGADDLEGGPGADIFVYAAPSESTAAMMDRIRDFTSGVDRIDLSALGPVSLSWASAEGGAYTIVNVAAAAGDMAIRVDGTVARSDFIYSNIPLTRVGTAGDDQLSGLNGNDTFLLQQGGHDTAFGDAGNDGFYLGAAIDAGDGIDGGEGSDTLAIQGNVSVALGAVTHVEVLAVLSGADARFGDVAGNRYDYAIATSDSNVAAGQILSVIATGLLPGEDLVFDGSAESDGKFRIYAGQGVDDLRGGAGSDGFFFGADGNLTAADHVDGGGGTDTIALRGDYTGARAVALANASFANVEVLALLSGHTNEFSGTIVASGFDYDVATADGNVAGGATLDINGARLGADEQVRFDGRAETDGAFRILSGAGDDTLFGGGQADLIYGGLGADVMDGGGGDDIYLYRTAGESSAATTDRIVFGADDRIDLRLVDANSRIEGVQGFSFIGSLGFTGAGQLRAYQSGATWMVEGDVDGDGQADLVIAVTGAQSLGANDFLL